MLGQRGNLFHHFPGSLRIQRFARDSGKGRGPDMGNQFFLKAGNFLVLLDSRHELVQFLHIVAIDESSTSLVSIKKVLLADEKGNVIKEMERDKNDKFNYELLPVDVNKLSTIYVDDPWLNIVNRKTSMTTKNANIVIAEKVYFSVNDFQLQPDTKKILDKVIAIMNQVKDISIELGSHTDSQGSDEYNMQLSEKRAKSAFDYMIAQGISATRITGKGYGETHLLNNCGNGVKCSEEEHSKNRRLEFKVIKK